MNILRRRALARAALSEATVQSFYDGSRSGTAEQCLKALCESHERLRAELQGALVLIEDARGDVGNLRSLLARLAGHHAGPCLLDHHGYCQGHNFAPPCPVPEMLRLLEEVDCELHRHGASDEADTAEPGRA